METSITALALAEDKRPKARSCAASRATSPRELSKTLSPGRADLTSFVHSPSRRLDQDPLWQSQLRHHSQTHLASKGTSQATSSRST